MAAGSSPVRERPCAPHGGGRAPAGDGPFPGPQQPEDGAGHGHSSPRVLRVGCHQDHRRVCHCPAHQPLSAPPSRKGTVSPDGGEYPRLLRALEEGGWTSRWWRVFDRERVCRAPLPGGSPFRRVCARASPGGSDGPLSGGPGRAPPGPGGGAGVLGPFWRPPCGRTTVPCAAFPAWWRSATFPPSRPLWWKTWGSLSSMPRVVERELAAGKLARFDPGRGRP